MPRLVAVATGDSSAGCLKVSRVADKVFSFNPQLLGWPAPHAASFDAFIAARAAAVAPDPALASWDWTTDLCSANACVEVIQGLRECNRIELWVDAGPQGQLKMLLFLWWLAEMGGLRGKLFLRHGLVNFGEYNSAWMSFCSPEPVPISDAELRYAAGAWQAWTAPTPERWHALLKEPIAAFPQLKLCVWETLCWLPSPGRGLNRLEEDILYLIRNGLSTPNSVMHAAQRRWSGSHIQVGSSMVRLAHGEQPAIEGLEEPAFVLSLREVAARRERFDHSPLSLTAFGGRVLKGTADYWAHNRIDRWWGGTHLTPDNLWRFDQETGKLCPPKSLSKGRAKPSKV